MITRIYTPHIDPLLSFFTSGRTEVDENNYKNDEEYAKMSSSEHSLDTKYTEQDQEYKPWHVFTHHTHTLLSFITSGRTEVEEKNNSSNNEEWLKMGSYERSLNAEYTEQDREHER